MRAAIYCRISRDPTGRELGVRRQLADCEALATREGWSVAGTFVDDDLSAYTGKLRPGFVALAELLKGPGVDVVVAWHPDRLTRHPRELEDLIDLLEATSTTVRCCQTGEYDLGTPSGRMAARIVGAVARHESEHKSARLRRKHVELAEGGMVSGGGTRPFGYDVDRITVRSDEAAVVRELAARLLAGETTRSLAADLNGRGILTGGGKPWTPFTLRRMLASARIAGLREHHGQLADAVWPAIVTPADHRRLVAVLRDPARRPTRGRPRHLLTGLLVCGKCGERLVARPRGDKTRSYVCQAGPGLRGCGRCQIVAEPLEDMIVAAALARVASPAFTESFDAQDDPDDGAVAELASLEARAAELADMWAAGELDRASWSAARESLASRRAQVEATIAAQPARRPVAALVDESTDWQALSHDQRRAALAQMIDKVDIGPAVRGRSYFDPSRIGLTWAN